VLGLTVPLLLLAHRRGNPMTARVSLACSNLVMSAVKRRALVGLVRVRPAEGVLSPPAQGTWEALASADAGAFPEEPNYG
jgi:hypothetical protein